MNSCYRTPYIEKLALERAEAKLDRINKAIFDLQSPIRHRYNLDIEEYRADPEYQELSEASLILFRLKRELRLEWREKQESWV